MIFLQCKSSFPQKCLSNGGVEKNETTNDTRDNVARDKRQGGVNFRRDIVPAHSTGRQAMDVSELIFCNAKSQNEILI